MLPDLERTARSLEAADLTGPIDPSHVWQGAPTNLDGWPYILEKMSYFVGTCMWNERTKQGPNGEARPVISQDMKNALHQALKRTYGKRMEGVINSFGRDNPQRTIARKTWQRFGTEFSWIDMGATREQNPDWASLDRDFETHAKGGNHLSSISPLKAQLEQLSCFDT